MTTPPSRKKRVRPSRKIVPRGQMGPLWVVAPIALAFLILLAGVVFLLTRGN